MLQIQICLTLLILGASGGSPFSQAPQRSESEYSMRIQLPDGQYGCSDWFLGIEGHEHEYFDPFLGVNNPGIRVTRVLNGYPAQRMGLRPGDVVTSMTVNGRDYTRFRRMGDLVRALSVSRDGIAVVRPLEPRAVDGRS